MATALRRILRVRGARARAAGPHACSARAHAFAFAATAGPFRRRRWPRCGARRTRRRAGSPCRLQTTLRSTSCRSTWTSVAPCVPRRGRRQRGERRAPRGTRACAPVLRAGVRPHVERFPGEAQRGRARANRVCGGKPRVDARRRSQRRPPPPPRRPQDTYTTNPTGSAETRPSPYKDGLFKIHVDLESNYPQSAPKVRSRRPRHVGAAGPPAELGPAAAAPFGRPPPTAPRSPRLARTRARASPARRPHSVLSRPLPPVTLAPASSSSSRPVRRSAS
jgi:hypothetical protein